MVGLEVRSGRAPHALSGLRAFDQTFKPRRTVLVGQDGIPLEDFLSLPVEELLHG